MDLLTFEKGKGEGTRLGLGLKREGVRKTGQMAEGTPGWRREERFRGAEG